MHKFKDFITKRIDYSSGIHGLQILVPGKKDFRFNLPYVLFLPDGINDDTTLIVEGANSDRVFDNIEEGIQEVLEESMDRIIYDCNKTANFPILTPLFPRYFDKKLKKEIFFPMLTSDSLHYENDIRLMRVDIQLVNMIEDARKILEEQNIIVDNKVILDGFSASSKFVNRFALLHPEIVKLIIAGGISSVLTIPLKTYNGEKLLYPIGCGNIDEITDEKIELFRSIKQFYYLGEDDTNDPFVCDKDGNPLHLNIINYDEASQLNKILGIDMQKERWKNLINIYNDCGVNAKFQLFSHCGHSPVSACKEITDLLDENIKQKKKR